LINSTLSQHFGRLVSLCVHLHRETVVYEDRTGMPAGGKAELAGFLRHEACRGAVTNWLQISGPA
ncbi:MAG TPA: hypothetical protein VF774_14975, partial [Pseudoduganella sp.]